MRADGMTFCPRHTSDPAGTEDPDGRERPGGVPHKEEVGVETTTDSTRTTSAAWVANVCHYSCK